MAMKVKPNENNSTDLVSLDAMLPVAKSDLVNITSPDSRLPILKLISPIEIDGTRIKPEHSYAFGMFQGEAFQPLPAGIIMTVLAARDATRQLQVEIGGKTVANNDQDPAHKTAKKSYSRNFKGIGKYNKSHESYVESLKDRSYQTGIDYLVAVIGPDGVAIADLPAFKTQSSYWHKPLGQALMQNKLGCRIDIANHAVNVVSAKSDPTKKYVGPQKFDQFKIIELSNDQLRAIQEAYGNVKADVESWFDR